MRPQNSLWKKRVRVGIGTSSAEYASDMPSEIFFKDMAMRGVRRRPPKRPKRVMNIALGALPLTSCAKIAESRPDFWNEQILPIIGVPDSTNGRPTIGQQ
ncbi:hypothetical protein SAMN05216387_102166 [Nitrosovibrio tenuis]|uniref:Uncharacterized protein n=1 Tax=Nitrosovibrio tenuis TaxID=1233 RepID=A0A1H7IGJ6_9PROT|nr:hypothetical protein SAMN05216387_102166 [Nitrosovibrio tenuis]